MPGPQSKPQGYTGKTAKDRATGKHARHEQNRQKRANEDRGGKAGK